MTTKPLYATANITFRSYEVHADLVKRAAKAAGKNLSDYVRDIVIPWAASDLGERVPAMPKLERGRHSSMAEEAAKVNGMTREQFERQVVEIASALALGHELPEGAAQVLGMMQPAQPAAPIALPVPRNGHRSSPPAPRVGPRSVPPGASERQALRQARK